MILITGIEYGEVPGHTKEIAIDNIRRKMADWNPWDNPEEFQKNATYEKELVLGREFRRDNESYIIGMTKEVQDILKLPFECFESLQNRNNELISENNILKNRLKIHLEENEYIANENSKYVQELVKLKSMNLWTKIKFIFSKRKLV